MPPPNDLHRLSDDDWKELQRRADQFAETILPNPKGDWTPLLQGLSPDMRRAVLHECIKIDLDAGWKSGRKPTLDEYLRKFPELGPASALPGHLVYEEYRVRLKYGDRPEGDEYAKKYPHLKDTLGILFNESQKPTQWDTMAQAKPAPPLPPGLDYTVNLPAAANESVLPAVGEYQLQKLLGKGQFGEVWLAKAPGGVEVAVKVITQPADQEAAQREVQALELVKNLRHPALMSTLAFWTHLNKVYIVAELADGTLRDRLKECKAAGMSGIPAEEMVGYFTSAGDALDFLHAKKVFHRDIKPDNLLLVNGHAKVADFGLARAGERPDTSVSFAGTPVYMAPEVWGGKYGPQSDLYSLAMTYAELRLGRRPLDANDFMEMMTKQREHPPDLEGLPPAEREVVAKALSKQPAQRQKDCKTFAAELRAAVNSLTVAPTKRKPPFAAMAASAVLVAAIVVGAWFIFFRGRPVQSPTTDQFAAKTTTEPDPTIETSPKPPIIPSKTTDSPKTVMSTPQKVTPTLPSKDPVVVPDGYRAVEGASTVKVDGTLRPTRVERDPIRGIKPTFTLIATDRAKPYYVLETKVWNGLFDAFLTRDGNGGQTPWAGQLKEGVAVNMSALDAQACAAWLGGRLPTPAEWDVAAGFIAPVTKELSFTGQPAIGLGQPRGVNVPARDFIGASSVSDMLGNGREWTGEVIALPDGKRSPLTPAATDGTLVVLRGRSFTLAKPLTAADLEYEQAMPQTQYAKKGSRFTGFRVVIPVD